MYQCRFMAKVLVTGFEPFSKHSRNISGDVVESLNKIEIISDPWLGLRDYNLNDIEINLETILLSVDEIGSKIVAKRLSHGEEWDAIIHLGLCNTCKIAKIELRAKNILDMNIKDNSGRQLTDKKLGKIDYSSTIEANLILTNKDEINAEISVDAGRFVCNETYYNTLAEIDRINLDKKKTPCLFLHLPDYNFLSLESARNLVINMIARILFKPVISVSAGVITDGNRMLVARRNDHMNSGLWEFPGGKLEWGETPSQAIERELKEEFNWDIISIKSFGKWFHKTTDFDIDLNVEHCQFVGSIPNLDSQECWTSHDEIKWIADEDEVSPYIGLDRAVAEELSKELSNPSGRFS